MQVSRQEFVFGTQISLKQSVTTSNPLVPSAKQLQNQFVTISVISPSIKESFFMAQYKLNTGSTATTSPFGFIDLSGSGTHHVFKLCSYIIKSQI